MQEDAVFDMPADGASQNDAFDVTAQAPQVVSIVAVIDPQDVLLYDRAGVQILGDIVGGCTDEFDTAVVSGLVRVGADECGQEPVVDVDDPRRVPVEKDRAEDLHIARQDHGIDLVLGKNAQRIGLGLGSTRGADRDVKNGMPCCRASPALLVWFESTSTMSAARSPAWCCQSSSSSAWSARETNTASRFRRAAWASRQSMPKRPAIAVNACSISWPLVARSASRNSVRMKNVPPSSAVECWLELMMFAPRSNRKCDTAATTPGLSGQEIKRRPISSFIGPPLPRGPRTTLGTQGGALATSAGCASKTWATIRAKRVVRA